MILKVAMEAVLKCVSEWKMNFGEKQRPSTECNKKKAWGPQLHSMWAAPTK